jgi:hypothetical protein
MLQEDNQGGNWMGNQRESVYYTKKTEKIDYIDTTISHNPITRFSISNNSVYSISKKAHSVIG